MNKSGFVLYYNNKSYDIYCQKNYEYFLYYIKDNEKFIPLNEELCEIYSLYKITYLSKPTEHTINDFITMCKYKEINNKNDLLKFLNISDKYNELSYDDCDKLKESLRQFIYYKHVYSSGFCFEIKINDKKYRFRKYKNEDLYIEEYNPIIKQFK